jgi:hypothetical protein
LGRLFALVVGLAMMALMGCAPSTGTVSGKVTYNGAPLKGGTVALIPEGTGMSFSTTINEDGTYSIPQVEGGKYKVCVETETLKPGATQRGPTYGGKSLSQKMGGKDLKDIKNAPPPDAKLPEGYKMTGPGDALEMAKRYVQIPATYGQPDTTTLHVEVRGNTTYDIPLK